MGVQKISSADIESMLCSLANVSSARVVIGNNGNLEEIHVLADAGRTPKQVVRDIESALMAQFSMEIDHKIVSIAQTNSGKNFRFVDSRLKFSDVSITLNGVRSEAIVRLKRGEDIYVGAANGLSTGSSQGRLVATATLRAVENCQGSDGSLVLEDITTNITLCGRQVVVVGVSILTSRNDDFLVGSALVKQDLCKAVVNATLDAVNRRLGLGND